VTLRPPSHSPGGWPAPSTRAPRWRSATATRRSSSVVSDIVRFAREQATSRSARAAASPNSLVAYCTGITTVDPLEHGLLFERFLNPARANPPDIDLDFCSRRRDEVLVHLRETFGADLAMALVGTVSTMRPQSAVRETGKAYGLEREAEINRLVALMPHRWHPDPRRRDRRTMDDILEDIPGGPPA
jgi:DNA polymerase III alpha subunit